MNYPSIKLKEILERVNVSKGLVTQKTNVVTTSILKHSLPHLISEDLDESKSGQKEKDLKAPI